MDHFATQQQQCNQLAVRQQYQNTSAESSLKPRTLDMILAEINFYENIIGESLIQAGFPLIEAKEMVGHRHWMDWCQNNVKMSTSNINRAMRLARAFMNSSPVINFGSTKALILLQLPKNEVESFINESHDVNGIMKSVDVMTKRELELKVRNRRNIIRSENKSNNISAADDFSVTPFRKKRRDSKVIVGMIATSQAIDKRKVLRNQTENMTKSANEIIEASKKARTVLSAISDIGFQLHTLSLAKALDTNKVILDATVVQDVAVRCKTSVKTINDILQNLSANAEGNIRILNEIYASCVNFETNEIESA
jgi:hypothetical protein